MPTRGLVSFPHFALSCHALLHSFLLRRGVISFWKSPHPGGKACSLLWAPLSSHLLSQVPATLVDEMFTTEWRFPGLVLAGWDEVRLVLFSTINPQRYVRDLSPTAPLGSQGSPSASAP